MGTQPKQSTSAKTALIYITIGALMDVWTAIYYLYLSKHSPGEATRYWCLGFFFTGLVLFIIGLAVGRIGRSAVSADVAATPDVVVASPRAPIAVATQPEVVAAAPTPKPVVAANSPNIA